MKTVVSYVVMFLTFVSVFMGSLALCESKADMPEKLNVGSFNTRGPLDRNLLAIANDPSVLRKIDQKANFMNGDAYSGVLQKALDRANKLIPAVMKEHSATNFTTAVCVADARVYCWNTLGDRVLIGWIAIPEIAEDADEKSKVTVWVIPRLHKETPFAKNWKEHAKGKDVSSTKALMKTALDIDIADAEKADGEEQVRGTATVDDKTHSAKMFRSGNVLQAEIMLLSDESANRPGKPAMREAVLNKKPVILPFWPPK